MPVAATTLDRAAEDSDLLTFALIDDDPAQHVMLAMAIKNAGVGATLTSFFSGEQFVSALGDPLWADFQPNVILLDLRMPGIGGYETLEYLQSSPDLCDVPVVILTSSDRPAERSISLERGARLFYHKPHELSRLESLVYGLPLLIAADRVRSGQPPLKPFQDDKSFLWQPPELN